MCWIQGPLSVCQVQVSHFMSILFIGVELGFPKACYYSARQISISSMVEKCDPSAKMPLGMTYDLVIM